jgi:lysyl-tRNA synthetase class 2
MGIGMDRLIMYLTNNQSIQEVLFFPQMKPEKKAAIPKPEDFIKIGVPQDWVEVVMNEFLSVTKLKENKATQVHQKLNGLRKKNKLNIPALQLEEVEKWL